MTPRVSANKTSIRLDDDFASFFDGVTGGLSNPPKLKEKGFKTNSLKTEGALAYFKSLGSTKIAIGAAVVATGLIGTAILSLPEEHVPANFTEEPGRWASENQGVVGGIIGTV